MKFYASVVFVVLIMWQCTCNAEVPLLFQKLIAAPNYGVDINPKDDLSPEQYHKLGIDRELRVNIPQPAASILVSIIEPRDNTGKIIENPRGTIFCLHGLTQNSKSMLEYAHTFATAGYRAVLIDSRGHGRSSGQWLTYGVQESKDLSVILDTLEKQKLIKGPYGVFGFSYGASTALQWAGHEKRIKAAVSLAAFASLRGQTMNYIRLNMPFMLKNFTKKQIQLLLNRAAELAGFNPDDASAAKCIARTSAAVLLLHGECDTRISPQDADVILKSAQDAGVKCQKIMLADSSHDSYTQAARDTINKSALALFDRELTASKLAYGCRVP